MKSNLPVIDGLTVNQVWTLVNARGYKQFLDMYNAYKAGKCLFCDPLGEKNVVIYNNSIHRAWINPFPLKHTDIHIIIAPVAHIIGTNHEVTFSRQYLHSEADAVAWLYQNYRQFLSTGGGEVKRFGDAQRTSGTIEHDHRNLIVPNLQGEVRMTLAKEPEDIEQAILRLKVYIDLHSGKLTQDLSSYQLKLVEGRLN